MKKIYWAYSEEYGEVEGMFDENDNLIYWWARNDASWRQEYFGPFMESLGVKIVSCDYEKKHLVDKLTAVAKEYL